MASAEYALVIDGTIREYRIVDLDLVPSHKRSLWRPVVRLPKPPLDPGQTAAPTETVSADEVRHAWSVTRRGDAQIVAGIKEEALRRIVAALPEWKQLNMTARGVELLKIGQSNWTPEQQAENAALQAAWDWVKAVRAASDALEATDPLPTDYGADGYWPAPFGG